MLELTQLQSKFDENVLDAINAWTHHVLTDGASCAGSTSRSSSRRAQRASEASVEGWLLALDQPTYVAVVTDAESEPLRRALLRSVAHARLRSRPERRTLGQHAR